jgi:hypothetical protein
LLRAAIDTAVEQSPSGERTHDRSDAHVSVVFRLCRGGRLNIPLNIPMTLDVAFERPSMSFGGQSLRLVEFDPFMRICSANALSARPQFDSGSHAFKAATLDRSVTPPGHG